MGETSSPANRSSRSLFSPSEVPTNRTPKRQSSESFDSFITSGGTRVTIPAAHPHGGPETSADESSINSSGIGDRVGNNSDNSSSANVGSIMSEEDGVLPKAFLEATAARAYETIGVETIGAATSGNVVHYRTKKIGKPRASKTSKSSSKNKKNANYSAFRKPVGDRTKKMARPRLGSKRRRRIIAVVDGQCGDQNSCGDTENSDSTSDDGNSAAASIVGCTNGMETGEVNEANVNGAATGENDVQNRSMRTETREGCLEESARPSSSPPSVEVVRGNSRGHIRTNEISQDDSNTISRCDFGIIGNDFHNGESGDRDASNITVDYAVPNPASSDTGFTIRAENRKLDGNSRLNENGFAYDKRLVSQADNDDESERKRNDGDDAILDTHQLQSSAVGGIDTKVGEGDNNSRFSEVSETSGNQYHFGGNDTPSAVTAQHCNVATCNLDVLGEEDNLLQSPICEEEGIARGKESSWEIGFASSKIQQSNKDFFMRPVVDDSAPNMLSTSEIVQNQQRLCCQGNVKSDNTFDNSGDENGKSESNVTHQSTRRLNDLITSGAEETSLNSVEVIGSITKKGPCIEAKISCHRTNPDKNNSEDDSLFGSDDDIIEDEKALSGNPSQKDVECKLRFGLAQNIEMTSGSIYGNRPREIVIDSKANETQNRNNHYHALNEFGIFEPPTRELDGKDSDYESSGEGSVYSISAHEQSTKNTGYDIPRKKTANNLSKEFVHVCPDLTDCSITRESKPSTSSCPTKVPELDQLIKRGHQQKMSLIQLPHDSNKARNLLKTNDDESDIRMLARQFKERQDTRENKRSDVAGARPGKKVSFGQNTVYEEPRRRVLGRAARAMTKEVTDISTREKTSNLRSSPPPRAKPAALAPKANAAQNDPNDHGDKKSETQRKYKENQWNKRFDSLRSYITNHNDCNVPEGHSLHKWIIRERNICLRLMRKRTHELSKESPIEIFTKLSHIVKLNSIGFDFGKPTTVRVAEFISSASTVLSPKQRKMLTIEDDSFKSKPVKYPLKQKKRNFKGKFKTCKRSQTRSSSARQSNELSEDEVGVGQTVGESKKNCSKITSQTIEKGTIESDNDQIAGIGGSFTGLQDAEEISTPTSSSKRRKRMSAVATASALISSFSDTNAMDDQVTFSVDNFAGNASEKLQQEHLICPNQKDSADTDEEKQKTNRSGDSNQATFHPLPYCDDHLENERCEDSMDDELNIATGLSKNLLCCTDNGMLSQTASKSPNSTMDEGAKDVSGGADSPAPQEAGPNMDGTDGNSFITPKKRSKTESNNGNDESIESLEKKSRKRAPKASETSTLPPSVKTSFAGGGKSSEKSELITTSTPAELRWQQRLQEWIEFDESAQGKDPQSSTMKQLANWVRTQRTEYRFLQEGRKSAMTSARIELLEKAGFKWKKEPRMTSPAKASKTALLGGNDDKTPPQPSNETTRSFDVAKSNLIETAGLPRASSSAGSSKVVLVSSQQTRKTSKPSEEPSTKSELIENPTSARRKMSGIQDSKSSSLTETIADDDDNICDPASSTSKSHYVGHAQGFNVGDEVYAAWGNVGKKKKALYYPGSVKNSEDVGAGASRRRLYKIAFEDGDVAYNVEESDIILKQEYLEANLKPLLEVGDACYAAWWPTKGRRDQPAWYPGKVRSYKNKVGGRYGPVRLYDIAYDDGDKFNGVEDFYVFSKSEYELSLQKPVDGGKFGWNGVRNKIDKASIDKWANLVGYYVANIDGEEHCFSLLSSALRAYDDYVVRTKKSKTKKTDLNLPEEFRFKAQCKPTRIFALEEFSRAQTKTQGSKKEESFPLPASSMDENNANDDSGRKNKSSLTLKASEIMSRWQQREYKVVHVDSERQQQGEHIDSSEKSDSDEDEEEDDGMSVTQIHTNSRTKPVIKKNEQVYAVWSGGKDCNCWYPGRVWEAHVVTEGSGYGPVKKYDIVFDDGDVEKGVVEVFVMKKVDYEIGIEKDENDWVGVTNYLDRRSKDKYARLVGWYEFTTAAGEHRIYSSLHDALYAYDESIIEERGRPNIIASELNFPNARRKK